MKIYIVRHGETDWNREKRLQGRENIPLNETGVAQAHATGAALAGLRPDYILTSPLDRAVRTAEILAGHIGCFSGIRTEEGLTERGYGSLSGQQVENLYTAECGDMEPRDEVYDRVTEVFSRYEAMGAKTLLAVSHGGTIRTVLRRIQNDDLDPRYVKLKNACISRLDFENGRYAIDFCNLSADEYNTDS